MKTAIVGSRNLTTDGIDIYIPACTTEIVSGGAKGIDAEAKQYTLEHGIKYTEFLPEYMRFGKAAPQKRNLQIIGYADIVVAVWDGRSKGTTFVIEQFKKTGKEVRVYICSEGNIKSGEQ